jgi:hypothetical protein
MKFHQTYYFNWLLIVWDNLAKKLNLLVQGKKIQRGFYLLTISSAYYFLKAHLRHIIKSQKESQNRMTQGFLTIFA